MFHYMFSMTFKLVQPQFVPIYTVGLFQPRAMASSSPTTSIPIQEPVFLQFLHDVHNAHLLLHRAMALLPPTLIPNIEPTPLPSTDVWNQPEGLRPIYSDQTNAFIDAVHLPSPDHADDEALMDDLLEPNLPEPHQHVAAPPPDALPDPLKLSTVASTPPKRKQKAKAAPKAPAKRRRLHEQSRSRSPSPLTNWTSDEKQKLRTLKSDEKSRFSWRVISTKMGKSEADVRSMWNKLKDTLGWVPVICKRKKEFTAETFHHLQNAAVYVSPFHVVKVYFHQLTTLLPFLTNYCTVEHLEPFDLSLYTCRQLFYYVSPHSPGSILSSASHGQRPHLAHQTITLSDQSIFFRYGYLTVSSSTGLDTSIYYTPSTSHPTIGFETYATIGSQKSVLQHFGTQGRRQPLHWNIWQPFPDLQSDLSRLRPQSFCFGLENRGDRYHSTKMVDTPSSHRLLHDDRYGPRSPDAWWSSPLSFGHLELVLSFLEDSPTPRCLHVSRMLTSCADTTSRSTWYGLCCTNSSDSSRASFRYGNEIYKNCSLNLETHGYQPRKGMKTGTLLEIFVLFRWKSLLPIFFLLTPSFLEFHQSYFLLMWFFSNLLVHLYSGIFRLQIAFELIIIYSSITWRTTRLMAQPGCFQHLIRWAWPIPLAHLYNLMIQPRHRIFPVRPEWFRLLPLSTLFSSRRSITLSLLDLMNFGSWNGPKMAEKPGSLLKHFWKTCTSRVTGRHYAPPPTNGASTTTYPSTHPPLLRQHHFRFFHILNIPTSMSHNHLRPYRINYTFSNLAGDALLNITHKVQLHLYLGHHGDLHHHPHHRQHFTEPFTRTPLLHLYIILIDQYHLTNRALWICLTPACNAPLRFATVKKTDYLGFYWVFIVVQFLLQLFLRYSSPSFGNFSTMQLGLNFLISTPWLLPLDLIHIALHLRWTHLKDLELLHGLLDTEAFLVTGTLLHPDRFWFWWITLLYKNWHIAANLIMPNTVLLPVPISETLVLENLKLFSPGHASLNQLKQAFSHCEIYAQHWQRDYAPNGIFTWYLRTWNFATLIFKEMFSKYQSIGPSCNFWMNTDLNGASGSTTTSNLLGSYLVLHSLSYCDFVAIKFAKVLTYRDFMRNPDRGVKRQYNLTTVLIRLNRLMSCHLHKTEFICLTLDSGLRQRLYLLYVLLLY